MNDISYINLIICGCFIKKKICYICIKKRSYGNFKSKRNSKLSKSFLELVRNFDFVEFVEPSKKTSNAVTTNKSISEPEKAYLERLKGAVPNIKALSTRNKSGQSLKSFLDEL